MNTQTNIQTNMQKNLCPLKWTKTNTADSYYHIANPNCNIDLADGTSFEYKFSTSTANVKNVVAATMDDDSYVKSCELGDSIANIGESCFYNCKAFTDMSADCIGSIGEDAFYGCTSLSAISFNSNSQDSQLIHDFIQNGGFETTFDDEDEDHLIYVVDRNYYGINSISVYDGNQFVESYPKEFLYGLPFCFTANEPNASVAMIAWDNNSYKQIDVFANLEYSFDPTDESSWQAWDGSVINLQNAGDKVYIRGDNPNGMAQYDEDYGYVTNKYHKFLLTGSVGASGNIQYLLSHNGSKTDVPAYAYYYLFASSVISYDDDWNAIYSDTITSAPELPSTTLADACYSSMFNDCTSLTSAPELPATTLADACYSGMFNDCTSLTSAPELPATILTDNCYNNMFGQCQSLLATPELPATTLAEQCYWDMFNNCTSLTSAPELPATTLANQCYSNMFYGCTKFSEVHMKSSMNGIYDTSIHGDITKEVKYDL